MCQVYERELLVVRIRKRVNTVQHRQVASLSSTARISKMAVNLRR